MIKGICMGLHCVLQVGKTWILDSSKVAAEVHYGGLGVIGQPVFEPGATFEVLILMQAHVQGD